MCVHAHMIHQLVPLHLVEDAGEASVALATWHLLHRLVRAVPVAACKGGGGSASAADSRVLAMLSLCSCAQACTWRAPGGSTQVAHGGCWCSSTACPSRWADWLLHTRSHALLLVTCSMCGLDDAVPALAARSQRLVITCCWALRLASSWQDCRLHADHDAAQAAADVQRGGGIMSDRGRQAGSICLA